MGQGVSHRFIETNGLKMHIIEYMPQVVPHLNSLVLKGAGHWLQLERADEINAALLAFLQKVV